MNLDKHPTSIQLFEGANDELDKLAALLTLKYGRRFSRAEAHRHSLSEGMALLFASLGATFDGPASDLPK